MRNYFFDKGKQIKTPMGQFILAYNKLDSHNYALERLENCNNNYVYDYYSSFEDHHFLRYFTCWEEQQAVVKKVQKEENVQKSSKKKSMGLNVFLSKKKAQNESQAIRIDQAPGKSRKQVPDQKQQQQTKIKVIYVQLQHFDPVKIPKQVAQIKISMAIIYLLAQAVNKINGIWPNMIPVLTNQELLKFVKKGGEKNQQLINLFNFAMTDRKMQEWSKQIRQLYLQYKKSGQSQTLSSTISKDLQQISKAQYDIILILQGKKMAQKAKILQPQILTLIYSGYKLPLNEFQIIILDIDKNTRQVTLQHAIQNSILLIGQSSNFIIRYLKTFIIK